MFFKDKVKLWTNQSEKCCRRCPLRISLFGLLVFRKMSGLLYRLQCFTNDDYGMWDRRQRDPHRKGRGNLHNAAQWTFSKWRLVVGCETYCMLPFVLVAYLFLSWWGKHLNVGPLLYIQLPFIVITKPCWASASLSPNVMSSMHV